MRHPRRLYFIVDLIARLSEAEAVQQVEVDDGKAEDEQSQAPSLRSPPPSSLPNFSSFPPPPRQRPLTQP